MSQLKKRIAIVDDAPFIREILRNIAIGERWLVVGEAETGLAAIEMVKAQRPAVIIMDLVLPEMNGVETAEKILMMFPRTKIIASSTVDQESILLEAIEVGCCSYVTKPYTRELLAKAVNQAFELWEEAS